MKTDCKVLQITNKIFHLRSGQRVNSYPVNPHVGDLVHIETVFDQKIGLYKGEYVELDNGVKEFYFNVMGVIQEVTELQQLGVGDVKSGIFSFHLPIDSLNMKSTILKNGFVKVLVHIPFP